MNGKNFVVVYDGWFYTRKPPVWGPTFSKNKEDAELFTEKQAKEVVLDLHDFKGICYRAA